MTINFKKIESKWQSAWAKAGVFEAKEDKKKKKYYVLEMYPYPSGSGLHMGHAFNYTIGDIFARFKRMQGFNVLHPMGYDSFGLPAENAAIKSKSHPRKFTDDAIKNFITQQKLLGISYDWSRILMSHDVNYYRWNQWLFLQLYNNGLAYRKKAPVNYCPKCDTVLANEQVHQGKCWKHEDTDVEIRNLEQWFLRTTKYAEELLDEVDKLDWPERIKAMQKNWIGKSQGAEIDFQINGKRWPVFTTRPDTIFGVTFLVVSAQHADMDSLITDKQKKDVEKFLKKIKSTKQEDMDKMDKEGVFTGSYAINPLTKDKVPVYAGNFVVAEYGSGMVMAVPAHDQRDFEFAKKYKLPIKQVIKTDKEHDLDAKAYTGVNVLVNSGPYDGLNSEEAKEHITKALEIKKIGRKKIQYKLRDWLVSRQRYWGTPIPVLYDQEGNVHPVEEKDLPVKLPEDIKFGKGNPLTTSKEFATVKKNGKTYRRETDTMDTFFDSSWYFLRFTDATNTKKLFDKDKANYWMPVDFYTGGAEHACMHLIYARFFTKVLRDLGFVDKNLDEPFKRLFNQGMVHGPDGFVMSKSRGNVVDPLAMISKYGADTLRLFLMSSASPDKDTQWSENGIDGSYKFVNKVAEYMDSVKHGKSDERMQSKVNKNIKDITLDIENLAYNAAIIKIRTLFDYFSGKDISKNDLLSFVKIMSPFTPHLAEEFWKNLGGKGFVCESDWPEADEKKINHEFEKEEKIVEGLIVDVNNILKIVKEKGQSPVRLYLYCIPKELEVYVSALEEIERRVGLAAKIYAVNDPNRHDPENKAKKAKPGKPGIYLE